MNKNAVVLLSGGLDSAIMSAYMKDRYNLKAGVFVNRGQSNYNRELAASRAVSEYLKIPLFQTSYSLDGLSNLISKEAREKVGVPARNLILAAMALPYVYALDCQMLALGSIVTDTFPDSNEDFRSKFTALASQTLERDIQVLAPFADIEKWGKAEEIEFANTAGHSTLLAITWSCWMSGGLHCGKCPACENRKEGFATAGITDPTWYEGDTE